MTSKVGVSTTIIGSGGGISSGGGGSNGMTFTPVVPNADLGEFIVDGIIIEDGVVVESASIWGGESE